MPGTPARRGASASASSSVREALAARRAAARAAASSSASRNNDEDLSEVSAPRFRGPNTAAGGATKEESGAEGQVAGGARPVSWAVEKARTSGRLNISARSLARLPSDLFAVLLDRSSDPPPLPSDPRFGDAPARAAWYECVDLVSLAASNNEIQELEEEIGDLTALKRVDFHSNKLSSLPASFSRLSLLTHLNLSNNSLTAFPSPILTLSALTFLDLSHNQLISLWTGAQVREAREEKKRREEEERDGARGFGGSIWDALGRDDSRKGRRQASEDEARKKEEEEREGEDSLVPFPRLRVFLVSGNPLRQDALFNGQQAGSGQEDEFTGFPSRLTYLGLAGCRLRSPLPSNVLGRLASLETIGLADNFLTDEVFDAVAPTDAAKDASALFPSLHQLDLAKNEIDSLLPLTSFFSERMSPPANLKRVAIIAEPGQGPGGSGGVTPVQTTFGAKGGEAEAGGEASSKREVAVKLEGNPLREETFRNKRRPGVSASPADSSDFSGSVGQVADEPTKTATGPRKKEVQKEQWEIEAEAGLLTEGAKRRARALQARRESEAAAAQGGVVADEAAIGGGRDGRIPAAKTDVDDEWGALGGCGGAPTLRTGRRGFARSRVDEVKNGGGGGGLGAWDDAPGPAASRRENKPVSDGQPIRIGASASTTGDDESADAQLSLVQQNYTASTRALNLSSKNLTEFPAASSIRLEPPPTSIDLSRNKLSSPILPVLSTLPQMDVVSSLRKLDLSQNKLKLLDLGRLESTAFPLVEELVLAQNALTSGGEAGGESSEGLFEELARVFPSLALLDLSYNALSSLSGVSVLLAPGLHMPDSETATIGTSRRGLRVLRLAGNKGLTALDELAAVAKGVDETGEQPALWRCEEVDVRDCEISKLPPHLGLLRLEAFLVDGNVFRIPQRKVWEQGGTRGLLTWLKDRIVDE